MKRATWWAWSAAGVATIALAVAWSGCENTAPAGSPLQGAGAGGAGGGSQGTGGATAGVGCLDTLPVGFPYQPGCCSYQVDTPEVTERGFDDGKVGGEPPTHVHASWAGPSDSTFAVNWRSAEATTSSQLLYGTDEAPVKQAEGAGAGVTLIRGHHMLYGGILDGGKLTRVHEAHACGLKASTTYYYKVGGPGAWSTTYAVATAPTPGSSEPFRFAASGDSRNDPTIFAQIQQAIAEIGVDFQLFTGDAVASGASQADWDAWFEAKSGSFEVQTTLASTPFMLVNGNHENLTVNYVAQFAMPQERTDGELAQGEEWYSFRYGNALFIALNDTPEASALGDAQRDWLDKTLAGVDRASTPWIVAFHHRSTYSCSNHGSYTKLRERVQPLFDKHQVDLVLSGHDHVYERSYPIRGLDKSEGKIAESDPATGAPVKGSGTVYVTTGGAGAPLYGVGTDCPHTYFTEKTRNYLVLDVEPTKMAIKAYRLDGTVLDELVIAK